jgi:hypothetical protein
MAKKQPKMTVRQFHALGQRVLKASARRKRRGEGVWGTLEELGAKTAAEKNRLQEARHFASAYSTQQLEQLCQLGRDKGRPLSRWHVVVLIRVSDRGQRDRLARRCAQEGWSVQRLETEVRRIGPRRGYGGRGPSRPKSIEETLSVTEKLADRWIRWVNVLAEEAVDAKQQGTAFSELPKKIRARLFAITREAELLAAEIEQQLKPTTAKTRKKPRRK